MTNVITAGTKNGTAIKANGTRHLNPVLPVALEAVMESV